VDLAAAITLNTKPIWLSALDLTDLEPYFGKASPATLSYMNSFAARLYNFTSSPLSELAASVLWGLRSTAALVEAFKENKEVPDTVSPFDIQFTDRVEVLERLVHQLWYIEDPAAPQHILFQTFGWTCLIYIYSQLRDLPIGLGMYSMLARKVKTALEICGELNVLLATFPDLMLWEVFICGRAANDRDKPFLAQQATKILLVMKLEDANEILAAADLFLWPERGAKAPLATSSTIDTGEVIEIDNI
jgi:hypothetical protein